MPNITIEYYGVTGTGRNVTEAKRDAGEQIRKALDGGYTPSLIHWRKYTVLLWREPRNGWGYRISHPEKGEIRERMWQQGTSHDQDDVLVAIARHIGDIGREHDEDPALTRPLFEALLRGREMEREFAIFCDNMKRNYTFQARYRHARDVLGLGKGEQWSNDCHDWAGMNPARRELWQGSEMLFLTPPWEAK